MKTTDKKNLTRRFSLLAISSLISLSTFGQWNESTFAPSGSVFEVAFPDATAAYITGDFGLLYKSADAGISWTQIYDFGPFSNLFDPNFINADTGFVSADGGVYRTFDSGVSWTSISANWGQPSGIPIFQIKITGEKIFSSFESNDTTYIVKSDNYGSNWEAIFQNYELNAQPYVFSFVDSLNGYFINPNELEQVYKTNNGFISIDTLYITNGPVVLQRRYDFKDLQYGYLYGTSGSESYPTRTWNSGKFYFPIDLDGFGVLPVLDLDFNTSKLFASSIYGKIFYSVSNGQNWVEQITPVNDPITSLSFINENQGIAVSGKKVLYTNNGGIVRIEEITNINSLVNVYPNPAADIIKLEIKTTQPLKSVAIIDISGKVLKAYNIIDRELDIKGLNAGTYYIRVETEEGTLTKKIIIK